MTETAAGGRGGLLTTTHTVAIVIGAMISAAIALHGVRLEFLKQDRAIKAMNTVPLDVTDRPDVQVVKTFPDGSRLYHVLLTVSAKNQSDQELPFSYSLFTTELLQIGEDQIPLGQALALDTPPNPFTGLKAATPLAGSPGLKWTPLTCVEHLDTKDAKVLGLLKQSGCPNHVSGGGMTGKYSASATNSYTDGVLVRARPGDFVGLSTAFGVKDCSDEDQADCSLMQEIVQLP